MTKARDLANASTALSAVSATELGYLDGVTSAVQTQMDAKLATATASSTYQPLVSGVSNTEIGYLDGVTSAIQTQLNQKPEVTAGKNIIINGGMDIWQRNTTFTNPGAGGAYVADRWCTYFNANATVTREATVKPDTSTYSMKLTATTSSPSNDIYQLIEQAQMQNFRGKSVTYSVKLAGTVGLTPQLVATYSTTADDSLFPTGTAISIVVNSAPAINASTFVTYSISFTVPIAAKTLRIGIVSNAMANTNVLYIAEAQLEAGLTPTPFSRAGGTIQGELAACQRYFQAYSGDGTALYVGHYWSSVESLGTLFLKQTMRVAPSMTPSSGTAITAYSAGVARTATTVGYDAANTNALNMNSITAAGTIGYGSFNRFNGSSAYVWVSAEL